MQGRISYANPRERKIQSSFIQEAANRMGIDTEQFLEREKVLQAQEEEDRLNAMDSNKSKFMSPEEKLKKLNAYKNRRFIELGIGHIPSEGQIVF